MPDAPAPDLSVVIVSWNVRELLAACLSSLRGGAQSPAASAPGSPAFEVILVDNASGDGTAGMVSAEFPWVRLIANPDNRGFTRGNNQGLAVARGRFVLFLNPDTEVTGGSLAVMVAYLAAHPEVGALGPRLRYGDGSLQSSRRRFPTLATALFESTPLAWHWPSWANPWARRYRMEDQPADREQYVDWVVGAALLTRREVLEQVGGFDEGYFMYSEELDWCRRVKQAGWQVAYVPAATIIHYEARSSGQVAGRRHTWFQSSKVRYFRKFHGPVAGELLRIALLGMFGVEWLAEAGKRLLGSKRPLRRERMAAYAQLLRSGLRGS